MATQTFLDLVKEHATEKTITVYETDNFDIFKLNKYNREISPTRVAGFKKQDLKDVIYPVNSKGEILDGQHRIMACRELNQKVRFMIIDNADEDYIHDINTVGAKWQVKDFIDHYSKRGLSNYVTLKYYFQQINEFSKRTRGSFIATLARFLTGKTMIFNHTGFSQAIGLTNGTYQIRTNPAWVINGYKLDEELIDQLNFLAQEKQINNFRSLFVQFCIILQYWGYTVNHKNVINDFKINMLLEIGNLAKAITKNDGDCIATFQTIFNRRKSRKFDYEQASKSYFQDVESGKIRKMVEPELQKTYEEICNQNEETKEE